MTKILQIRNIAVVSLLGFVMMFAAIAPSMNSASAQVVDPAVELCMAFGGPTWTGFGVNENGIILAKCWDTLDPCFAVGVPVKSDGPTTCVIAVLYLNLTGENVILKDAIPAEWNVSTLDASTNCIDNLAQANKNQKADKSATLLTCDASNVAFFEGILLDITTRESPGSGKGNQEIAKFKPTSCFDLFANSGAQVIAADEEGNPILVDDDKGGLIPLVLAETGPIRVTVTGAECGDPA